jgi:hypothetical protein
MGKVTKRIGAAFGVALLVCTAAHAWTGAGDPADATVAPKLDALVTVLKTHHVSAYRNQDWCRNLATPAGNYSTNNEARTCNLFDGAAKPFDAQGDRLFTRVREAVRQTGLEVERINVDYRGNRIAHVEVGVACATCHASYIYALDKSSLPERADVKHVASDWYYVVERD